MIMVDTSKSSLFVATPVHDNRVHVEYMKGVVDVRMRFADRIRIETHVSSFLPRGRDILTLQFLESGASHMLCVDSDIGWTADDAEALLASGKDFVSGIYVTKEAKPKIPAKLTGKQEGRLWEAEWVPAGFLLVSRPAVERMVGAYRQLAYKTAYGIAWALWASLFDANAGYDGEDVAFCRRWRQIGGEVWMHQGVVVRHIGERAYVPDTEAS